MHTFKQLVVFGALVAALPVSAQITTGKVGEKEPEEKKVEQPRRVPTEGLDEFTFYLGLGRSWSDRKLSSNDAPFGAPLGFRADETGLKTWTFQGGVRNRVNSFLSYDIGLQLDRFGESYNYEDTESDSTFSYTSQYSYYSLPVQVFATYGKDFRFFLGGGVQPELLSGYSREEKYTTTLHSTGDETVKSTAGLNQFGFGVLASAGIQWRLTNRASIYVIPTWCWNLTNTYDDQADYVHKARSFNLKFGLAFHLKQ